MELLGIFCLKKKINLLVLFRKRPAQNEQLNEAKKGRPQSNLSLDSMCELRGGKFFFIKINIRV